MKILSEFQDTRQFPSKGIVLLQDVDLTAAQTISIELPSNRNFILENVDIIHRIVDTLSAGAKVAVGPVMQRALSASVLAGSLETIFARSVQDSGYSYLQNIVAAGTTGLVTQVTDLSSPGSATVAAQPDVPRNVVLTLTDAADDDLAGEAVVTGEDVFGRVISETFTVEAGTLSYVGSKAFAKITSTTFDFGATGTNADTLDLGQGAKLGLSYPGLEIVKLVSGGTEEAASAVDADNGTFTPTTAPNGTNDYEVWYKSDPGSVDAILGSSFDVTVVAATATAQLADIVISLTRV